MRSFLWKACPTSCVYQSPIPRVRPILSFPDGAECSLLSVDSKPEHWPPGASDDRAGAPGCACNALRHESTARGESLREPVLLGMERERTDRWMRGFGAK